MSLCVVNYPTISQEDLAWIQSVRELHDPLFFDVVAPHFTLIFPTEAVDESALTEHVVKTTADVHAFDFTLRCAIIGDADFLEHAHAFLIPDEGFSDIVRLHDRLYTGRLAGELRLDLPYLPHIGVACTRDLKECKAIVDQLNEQNFEIRGRFESLDVIGYDGVKVWSIEKVPFQVTASQFGESD